MNMAIKTMALQQHWAFICYCLLCCQQHQGKVVSFFKFRFASISVNKFLWFYIRNFNRNVFGFCKRIFNKSLEFFVQFDLEACFKGHKHIKVFSIEFKTKTGILK